MKKNNSFVKNASFLMIAAMISKIIGLLYRSPMNAIVGDTGMGYYGFAFNVYTILLMISSYSIPMAVSKVVSERIALKQYKNAHKMFKGSMYYAIVVGLAAGLIAFFLAPWLLPSNQPNAIPALRALAPTIFLSAILGVLRGYFQAYNTMMPTSLSQIIEQILNAIISIVAAYVLVQTFGSSDAGKATYGAVGGTLGTGAGVLIALLFMGMVYQVNRKTIRRRIERDHTREEESYRDIFKVIILMVTPVIFSTFIYNINGYLNGYLFSELMGRSGISSDSISGLYGEYTNQYLTIINIPLALSSASSTAVIPSVAAYYAQKLITEANEKIDEAVQLTMFISIPAAVGLGVLSQPIVMLLFPQTTGTAGKLLMYGSITVLLYGLSNITNGVLQGIGKPNIPVIHAVIALVVDIVVLLVLLLTTNLGLLAVLGSSILYSLIMCILNDIAMRKYLGYRNKFKDHYGKPLLAAVGMGIVAFGVYHGVYMLLPINVVCLVLSILCAVLVYVILFVMISGMSAEALMKLPGGRYIYKLTKLVRIYK